MRAFVDLISTLSLSRPASRDSCGKFMQPRNHDVRIGCYRKLPGHLKRDLYKYVGEGYEESVSESMNSLGVTDFIMPKNRT
jgi:hypothetical protein